jgi:steroid 5-alpha reductase family enzyme
MTMVIVLLCLSAAMAGAWKVQRLSNQSGWIDTIWSLSVGAGGVAAALLADGDFGRRMCVLIMIAAWAARLGSHIARRTHGGGEDPRYEKLIDEWGNRAAWRLFLFLQIQGLVAFILVLAVYLSASNDADFPRVLDVFALLVAAVALCGEGVADAQLASFRKTPEAKTEVCETGLWRYSRHPNYFFEWLFWCCWPILAFSSEAASWLSMLAPLLMYWLLVHVSGIPPLEEHMLRTRGEKFRALQHRVNAFLPVPAVTRPLFKEKQREHACLRHKRG